MNWFSLHQIHFAAIKMAKNLIRSTDAEKVVLWGYNLQLKKGNKSQYTCNYSVARAAYFCRYMYKILWNLRRVHGDKVWIELTKEFIVKCATNAGAVVAIEKLESQTSSNNAV